MYSSSIQQQHSHFIDDPAADTEEERPAYSKILQWSIEKLSTTTSTGQRRRKQQGDLRRTLLIASAMGKARAGILHERALEFLETRPQMQPPTGYCGGAPTRLPQQPQSQVAEEPELPLAEPQSAFGYCPVDVVSKVEEEVKSVNDNNEDDALSASADAIVLSSVELSIQDLDEPPEPQQPPTPSRKRKQPARPRPKRTRQSLSSEEDEGDAPEDSATPPTAELRSLQASFVDLTMSAWSCRQQVVSASTAASSASAFGFGFGFANTGPECFSFA
ncbi:hypothetical protein BOX15_Mlig015533g1 [Macrostomum lignano]|uniref:Uncharacterized protein n=1 Tax=Macrostomum lignano TaxID=282301 RepID=A0A267DTP2_9PLAT|nr:hypothetical protein BOX15_Mlig030762g1 [Macrostomum lignano]PAA81457.1 hypothetical protein BOX15_Mlig015533g1 [Macrostomum lignano]